MPKRKKARKSMASKRPIGYVKVKGKYALVAGTKKNPKLLTGRYSSKKSLLAKAKDLLKKKR